MASVTPSQLFNFLLQLSDPLAHVLVNYDILAVLNLAGPFQVDHLSIFYREIATRIFLDRFPWRENIIGRIEGRVVRRAATYQD